MKKKGREEGHKKEKSRENGERRDREGETDKILLPVRLSLGVGVLKGMGVMRVGVGAWA